MRKVLYYVVIVLILLMIFTTMSYASQATTPAKILFTRHNGSIFELYSANADGTGERKITGNTTVEEARLSPDGTKIAFVALGTVFKNIYITDVNGGTHEYLHSGYSVAFSPDGTKLAFADGGNSSYDADIYIYDFASKQTSKLYNNDLGYIQELDWSPDGKKMIFTYIYGLFGANQRYLMQINTEGDPNPIALTRINGDGAFERTAFARQARYSPDGQKIVFSLLDVLEDDYWYVYTMNLDGSNQTRISERYVHSALPVWSPDGNSILYRYDGGTNAELYKMNPDGTNNTRVTVNSTYEYPLDWKYYLAQNNTFLKEIKVNGTAIPDFSESEYVYYLKLPIGTTQVPVVTAVAQDSNATVVVTNASGLPGTATIQVTAVDAVTSQTYTINFSVIPDQGVALTLGDYVQFGQYSGQPVLWRVINIDGNGPMLFSKNILTLKAFDASGDNTDGRGDQARRDYGSNYWEKANIREWLNSELSTVSYSHQVPDNVHVYNYYNDYHNEAGFLTNFTDMERQAINPVTHPVLLANVDTSVKDGGSQLHTVNESINNVMQNYNSAYYKNVTDKVFFLSIKEMKQYIYDRGWEIRTYPTEQAVTNSEYKSSDVATDQYYDYWLRDPYASHSAAPRTVYTDGNTGNRFAYKGTVGVRPALYIKPEIRALTGSGTLSDPFVITGEVVPSAEATLSEIRIDGNLIQGFNPDTLVYNLNLLQGTAVPAVSAAATDTKASVVITDAAQLPGSTTITVTAEDGVTQRVYTINFSVEIPFSITTTSLPTATAGTPYSMSLEANGGSMSYTWSATGLPAGLSIISNNGTVSGTPRAAGVFTVAITVNDSWDQSCSKNLTLTVALPELAALAAHYGQLVAGDAALAQYDLTPDGVIDIFDVVWVAHRLPR